MHRLYFDSDELTRPVELASNSDVTDKEVQIALKWYHELEDTIFLWINTEHGVTALIFLTSVTYHVISKIRGNEKNVQQNNFGIALAVLGLYDYSAYFTDNVAYSEINGKFLKWTGNHGIQYLWISWSSFAS